jgi:hypothetical protein
MALESTILAERFNPGSRTRSHTACERLLLFGKEQRMRDFVELFEAPEPKKDDRPDYPPPNGRLEWEYVPGIGWRGKSFATPAGADPLRPR